MQEADLNKIKLQTIAETMKNLETLINKMNDSIISANEKMHTLTADIEWYKDTKILDEVRQNIMRLYNSDRAIWSDASNSIKELIKNDNPVVRGFICNKLNDFLLDKEIIDGELLIRLRTTLDNRLKIEESEYVKIKVKKTLSLISIKEGNSST